MVASRGPRIINSIAEVAAAVRMGKRPDQLGRAIFLIGAGCSITAGVPGAAEIARRMVRNMCELFDCAESGAKDVDLYSALVARKRLTSCLKSDAQGPLEDDMIDWYRVYDAMFQKNYVTPDHVRDLFENLVQDTKGAINWAHLCLGELVQRKYVSTVLTTNFDQLALAGIVRAGEIPVVCDGMESLNRIVGAPRHPQLVELHGSRYTYVLRNRPEEVKAVRRDPQATAAIQALFQHATAFIAVGYGGRENGVMDLLVQAASAFPDKHLFWICRSPHPDSIGPKVRRFLATSRNGGLLLNQDADHFFLELCKELKVGAPTAVAAPLRSVEQVIDALARSIVSDPDIKAEIEAARDVLRVLTKHVSQARSSRAVDPSKMREARLAGNAAEAYRQATEDVETQVPAQGLDRRLLQETALAALSYGAQAREQKPLEQAVGWFRLLMDNPKDEIGAVTRWATGLGEALGLLGERDRDIGTLEQAIAARSAAVASLERKDEPLEWARAQVNLGNALQVLGRQGEDATRLEQAISAYQAALEEITRDRFPLEWASIQNNLGRVLTKLGRQQSSVEKLKKAVELCREASAERTRGRVPVEWALTQANIGEALRLLGEGESGTARLTEAISHYQRALQVLTPEIAPDRHQSVSDALDRTLTEVARRKTINT